MLFQKQFCGRPGYEQPWFPMLRSTWTMSFRRDLVGRVCFISSALGELNSETIEHQIEPDCPALDLTSSGVLDRIVAALEPYETVISDRLHGGLIAAMMRKKVVFLPVGYHKIRSFYETWLQCRPGSAYVSSQEELITKLSALQPPNSRPARAVL